MSDQTIMVCIWIVLAALAGLGFALVSWSSTRKELKGTDGLLAVNDRDAFMGVMRGFLDAKYSRNPIYNASPPANDLELYEFYRQWMKRLSGNPWKIVPIAVVTQLSMGLLALGKYHQVDTGTALTCLFSCTALVTLVSLLSVWRTRRRTAVLSIIDLRFREFTGKDRASLVQSSPDDRYQQAYRLNVIEAMPALATNQDMAASPRSMAEASAILRGGLALLVGMGFFLVMVFGGGILFIEAIGMDDSIFPVFLLIGAIGIPVIWLSLMIYWASRRKRLALVRKQEGRVTRNRQPSGLSPYFQPPAGQPDPACGQPQPASIICKGCGRSSAPDSETCPYCGIALLQA